MTNPVAAPLLSTLAVGTKEKDRSVAAKEKAEKETAAQQQQRRRKQKREYNSRRGQQRVTATKVKLENSTDSATQPVQHRQCRGSAAEAAVRGGASRS